MTQITAGGGILYRNREGEPEILIIKRNGVWDLPKGKLEANESISECAAREVEEEVGLNRLPIIEEKIGITTHSYVEEEKHIEKITHWYRMRLSSKVESFSPQAEEGITEVKWCYLEGVGKVLGYDNLRSIVRQFESSLREA